jgi:hypothetical protein
MVRGYLVTIYLSTNVVKQPSQPIDQRFGTLYHLRRLTKPWKPIRQYAAVIKSTKISLPVALGPISAQIIYPFQLFRFVYKQNQGTGSVECRSILILVHSCVARFWCENNLSFSLLTTHPSIFGTATSQLHSRCLPIDTSHTAPLVCLSSPHSLGLTLSSAPRPLSDLLNSQYRQTPRPESSVNR